MKYLLALVLLVLPLALDAQESSAEMTSLLVTDSTNVLSPLDQGEGLSFVNIIRGLFGLVVIILIAWLFSENRKQIAWKVVGIGLGIQLLLAIGVLQVPFIRSFFEFVVWYFCSNTQFHFGRYRVSIWGLCGYF